MSEKCFAELSEQLLNQSLEVNPTVPAAFYNVDGDCIEFLISSEGHYAERVDQLVTVYYGRESNQVVGALIKGVKRFIAELAHESPGFAIEVEDGKVRLGLLFTAGLWKQQGDKVRIREYKKIRDVAAEHDLEVALS